MKPAVAAALVSWLLMAPPIDTGWSARFDAGTPMPQWLVVNSYRSADRCEFARMGRVFTAMRALDRSPNELSHQRRHRLLIWAYLWECVPSDDPRLRAGN